MRGGRTATAAKVSSDDLVAGRRGVGSLVGHEHVTEAPYRLDVTRRRRIRFDQLAQPRYLNIDGAIEHIVVASAGKQHQLFTGHRLPARPARAARSDGEAPRECAQPARAD